MSVVLGLPAQIVDLVQQGAVERQFHDALFPNTAYRAEALAEQWPFQTGQEVFQSRSSLLTPATNPLTPGNDPTPKQPIYEQWKVVLNQFGDRVDTHMLTALTANANLFMRNIHTLGLGAGQTVNRIARNALFTAYLEGQTCLSAAAVAADTVIQVASISGFTEVLAPSTSGTARPVPVSAAAPLACSLGGVAVNVIAATPNDPNDPLGPGVLTLAAAVGGGGAANRTSLVSSAAPRVVRVGGGTSVDAIGAGDTLTLQDCINACALLRRANVQPHDDGKYHVHLSPTANAQIFADPAFRALNTALPQGQQYSKGLVADIAGMLFIVNTEAPEPTNCGTRVNTTGSAFYSPEIHAETTNSSGIDIGRTLITGKGAIYERWFDESALITEAGTTGKIGEFSIVNNGVAILTERVRLIVRSPLDVLQQVVTAAWSITTSFPVPSDITAPSGPEKYKRAIVIEHAN